MAEVKENNINNDFFFKIYQSGGNFQKNILHMFERPEALFWG